MKQDADWKQDPELTEEKVRAHEAEYLEWLPAWIKKKDEWYRASAKLTGKVEPIRKAGGKNDKKHATYLWFWGDGIWCGDLHVLAFEEFMGRLFDKEKDEGGLGFDFMDELAEFLEKSFNQTLKRVLPEIYWRELSGELDDKPTNDQERAWRESKVSE